MLRNRNMLVRLKLAVFRIANADGNKVRDLPSLERSLVPVLAVGSVLYKYLLAVRQKLYQWNILRSTRLPIPVISVGNISWGGNGKTPMVEYLAWQFLHCGIPPLILTRGYGGGDEVRLLEGHLQGTQALIGVARNRVEAATALFGKHGVLDFHGIHTLTKNLRFYKESNALHCLKLGKPKVALEYQSQSQIGSSEYRKGSTGHRKGIGVVLMDDGMQHWRISRDIEIVMVNAISLFGSGRLLPHGPLREPLDALKRADIVVIHHANLVSSEKIGAIKQRLGSLLHPCAVIFCSQMVPHSLSRVPSIPSEVKCLFKDCFNESSNLLASLSVLKNAYVLCISGIGCPESLSLTLEKLGAVHVERMDFPDHYHFQPKDSFVIEQRLRELKSKLKHIPVVILTEKDYARSPDFFGRLEDYDVFVLHSMLEVINDSSAVPNLSTFIASKMQGWKCEASFN